MGARCLYDESSEENPKSAPRDTAAWVPVLAAQVLAPAARPCALVLLVGARDLSAGQARVRPTLQGED